MPKITAKVPYAGSDPATGEEFSLGAGDSRDVSQQKVDQLKRDFPDRFDFGGRAGRVAAGDTTKKPTPAKRKAADK